MVERCKCCRGAKEIRGLGLIMQKCPVCKGIGHIESKSEVIETQNGSNVSPIIVRRRGRQKKEVAANG